MSVQAPSFGYCWVADRRTALRSLPRALASFEDRLDLARRARARADGVEVAKVARAVAPMTSEQLGRDHYASRLALRAVPARRGARTDNH